MSKFIVLFFKIFLNEKILIIFFENNNNKNRSALQKYGSASRLLRTAYKLTGCTCAGEHFSCICVYDLTADGAAQLAELQHSEALVFKKMARYKVATQLLTRTLTAYQRLLSPTHVKVGFAARDLGDALRKQDQYVEAREKYTQALKVI